MAHGLLCASLFSEIVGMHLPGRDSLCTEISSIFSKPVFSEDKLIVSCFVNYLSLAFQPAKIEAKMMNEVGEVCMKAQISVLFFCKEAL